MVIDELNHHRGRRSSSACAKYADALRKISFMRFSSRTSRSNAFARWRSAVVRPPRSPLSRSACRDPLPERFRPCTPACPQSTRSRPTRTGAQPRARGPAAPLALVLRGNTDSVVTWLHPLKEKALRQTRYGSGGPNSMSRVRRASSTSQYGISRSSPRPHIWPEPAAGRVNRPQGVSR